MAEAFRVSKATADGLVLRLDRRTGAGSAHACSRASGGPWLCVGEWAGDLPLDDSIRVQQRRPMNTSLQILFFIAVIILVAKLAGALSARVGLPLILGELLAGVVLGPTVLDIFSLPILAAIRKAGRSFGRQRVLRTGRSRRRPADVCRRPGNRYGHDAAPRWRPAFWAAAGGVVLPMAGGAYLARLFHFSWQEAIFIGTILTATSVTITAQTLMNLKQLRSRAGSTILAAAVIDDVMGLIVLSLVIALAPQIAGGGAGVVARHDDHDPEDGDLPDHHVLARAAGHEVGDASRNPPARAPHRSRRGADRRVSAGVRRAMVWWHGGHYRGLHGRVVRSANAVA